MVIATARLPCNSTLVGRLRSPLYIMLRYKLERAKQIIQDSLDDLDSIPETEALSELFDALLVIDSNYRNEYCLNVDAGYNEKPGTTYEDGTCMEFYIESDWWHDVSLALRKLGKGAEANYE